MKNQVQVAFAEVPVNIWPQLERKKKSFENPGKIRRKENRKQAKWEENRKI